MTISGGGNLIIILAVFIAIGIVAAVLAVVLTTKNKKNVSGNPQGYPQGNQGWDPSQGQNMYPGQNSYVGQDPYAGQNPYTGQDPYQGQNPYAGQDPYQGQNPYAGQDPYQGQNSYPSGQWGSQEMNARDPYAGERAERNPWDVPGDQGSETVDIRKHRAMQKQEQQMEASSYFQEQNAPSSQESAWGQSAEPQGNWWEETQGRSPAEMAQDPYQQNGYSQEPYQQNGYAQEPYPQNSYSQESYQQNGYAQEPYPQNNYPQDAYQLQSPEPQWGETQMLQESEISDGIHRLTLISTQTQEEYFADYQGGMIQIGRRSTCEIRIPNDKSISGVHCIAMRDGDQWFIRDNHSSNGTIMNNEPLTEERPLASGDVLKIGRDEYIVRID